MTDSELYDAFDDCLARLGAGEVLADCLQGYPTLAAELRPMLEIARLAQMASHVPRRVQMRSRAHFLAAAQRQQAHPDPVPALLRRTLSIAIAMLVGFILGTSGLYYASADTLPGDGLYDVKRAFENTQIQFTTDLAERLALQEAFNERRWEEAEALLAGDRTAVVNFSGPFVSRSATYWQVGDFSLALTAETQISGEPQPGFYVDVAAESHAGSLRALRLTVVDTEITGTLTHSGREWAINGVRFVITKATALTGRPEVGATATARVRSLISGDRVAISLTVLAPPPAPPTLIGTPAASSTSVMNGTPPFAITETPQPSTTPELSKTVEPTKTPELTRTPRPTATAGGGETETPEPDRTPNPTPFYTPGMTSTAGPTPTESGEEITETPEPTETPEADGGPSPTPTSA